MSNINDLIYKSVKKILDNSTSKEKINHIFEKHAVKPHFMPLRYRVLGGLLQSMNIQFGNFIETLMSEIISNEKNLEIVTEISGNKNVVYEISAENEERIDRYITDCQTAKNKDISNDFPLLLKDIYSDNSSHINKIKHDVDMLFRDKRNNKIYYLEMKYNDDHDTGKFIDINRKFIKTYAYFAKYYNVNDIDTLTPYLFYFTEKRMKGNIYVPEDTNILRGSEFFNKFNLSITYKDVEEALENFSEDNKNVQTFDELYNKIMNWNK